ncbi:hypothetical protein F511_40739 [Dorcoceras hygrometricum]|uniref:Uncharacterized protein n=1 Tax=Dorcoceras hygrometricum TaxID=472368 RepID=A0A2Z7A7D7_9LAMI|nr:hypothetical protein F511_40739 [Dorcoceras hygrometricum]
MKRKCPPNTSRPGFKLLDKGADKDTDNDNSCNRHANLKDIKEEKHAIVKHQKDFGVHK